MERSLGVEIRLFEIRRDCINVVSFFYDSEVYRDFRCCWVMLVNEVLFFLGIKIGEIGI